MSREEKIGRKADPEGLLRFKEPRVPPLKEVEYVQELHASIKATNRLKYERGEEESSDWDDVVLSLVKEMKGGASYYINPILSHLKVKEKGLDLDSINIQDYEEPIKEFIKKKETIFNLRATLMRHKDLFFRWNFFAYQVFIRSNIPPREKEIIIMRTAWLSRSEYEWIHHAAGSKNAGLFSEEEIDRIKEGTNAEGWSDLEALLIRSVDELFTQTYLSDANWKALSKQYESNQIMEICFIVGYYNMLAMTLNTFGGQLEDMYKKASE